MARKWLSGYEMNGSLEWTAATGVLYQTTTVRSGVYSGQITSLGSGTAKGWRIQFQSAAGNGPYYFGQYFRFDTFPSAENCFFESNDTNAFTTPITKATIDNTGLVKFYDEDSQITGTTTFSTSTWYLLEHKIDRTAAAGSHIVEFKVDGSVIATRSNADLSAGILCFCYGMNLLLEANTAGNMFVDDAYINDNTTSFQNTYRGEGEIIILRPDGDSGSPQWTRGGTDSGANWSQVEEVFPNDVTDYVTSNTLDQIDNYTLAATPAALASNDVIHCVMPGVKAAVDNATGSDPDITIGLTVSGNTDELTTVIDVNNTNYRVNNGDGVFIQYPPLANDSNYEVPGTSNAYTKADLDGMIFKLREAASDTHFARVTAVWVYVDHKPAPAAGGARSFGYIFG